MDLKQLQYFVAIVEEGTISAAAKKLFMSQPPLSAQMKLLESELGCVLFLRGQRHVRLTEAGRQLYAKAKAILELSRVTQEEMQQFADAEAGTIRVGIVSSVVSPMAADWIADFCASHPKVRFWVYEANTYELLEKLKSDILHLAIVRTPYAAEGITSLPLKTESLVAIGKDCFFAEGETVSLSALSALPMVLYRRWTAIVEREFEQAGLPFSCRCICDDARTAVDLIEKGLGVGLVPASAAKMAKGLAVRQLSDCRIESRIDLIYDERAYSPACAGEFREYLLRRFSTSTD
ncbi:MAG: LysR family transcriptional regulator [Christensenellales bacterium]|jgi:DNA-binding transcriptional LysR family regulator